MAEFPRSLIEFQRRFPDEGACAAYLAQVRWPAGFRCPSCGRTRHAAFPLPARHRRRQNAITYNMLIKPEATA